MTLKTENCSAVIVVVGVVYFIVVVDVLLVVLLLLYISYRTHRMLSKTNIENHCTIHVERTYMDPLRFWWTLFRFQLPDEEIHRITTLNRLGIRHPPTRTERTTKMNTDRGNCDFEDVLCTLYTLPLHQPPRSTGQTICVQRHANPCITCPKVCKFDLGISQVHTTVTGVTTPDFLPPPPAFSEVLVPSHQEIPPFNPCFAYSPPLSVLAHSHSHTRL